MPIKRVEPSQKAAEAIDAVEGKGKSAPAPSPAPKRGLLLESRKAEWAVWAAAALGMAALLWPAGEDVERLRRAAPAAKPAPGAIDKPAAKDGAWSEERLEQELAKRRSSGKASPEAAAAANIPKGGKLPMGKTRIAPAPAPKPAGKIADHKAALAIAAEKTPGILLVLEPGKFADAQGREMLGAPPAPKDDKERSARRTREEMLRQLEGMGMPKAAEYKPSGAIRTPESDREAEEAYRKTFGEPMPGSGFEKIPGILPPATTQQEKPLMDPKAAPEVGEPRS